MKMEKTPALKEYNMILNSILQATMGGGTGTNGAPNFPGIAKSTDILTTRLFTTPFTYKGRKQTLQSQGIVSLIVIPK
jgi:cell division GTPase FtsZ